MGTPQLTARTSMARSSADDVAAYYGSWDAKKHVHCLYITSLNPHVSRQCACQSPGGDIIWAVDSLW